MTTNDRAETAANSHRVWWAVAFVVGLILLNLIGLLMALLMPLLQAAGIRVTIQNTGSQPLGSVVLHVTGASYNLGDIPPGDTAEATVHATGESHLEIEFIDADGQTNRLDAGGYFEPGYRGTIDISIKDGVIQKNDQNIRLKWSLP